MNLDDLEDFENLEDLRIELENRITTHNQKGLKDFDGLSPLQMGALQHDFLTGESELSINMLTEEELKGCPLLMQIRFLIDLMQDGKGLKLTKTGALSTKVVKEIYNLKFLKNEHIERGITKLYKEDDAPEISITRILLQISSLTIKRKGNLYLTKKGEKYTNDGNMILKEILRVLIEKFNWGYFDGYKSDAIGFLNPGFSLFLLKKYGDKKRSVNFYAEKYFRAFPQLEEDNENAYRCYALQTFNRYFYFMGFIKKEEIGFSIPINIEKTEFFDKLFSMKS